MEDKIFDARRIYHITLLDIQKIIEIFQTAPVTEPAILFSELETQSKKRDIPMKDIIKHCIMNNMKVNFFA